LSLPPTLFFKYPTAEKLGSHLIQELLAPLFPTVTEASLSTEPSLDESVDTLESLSQDEIATLLAQELAAVKAEVMLQ